MARYEFYKKYWDVFAPMPGVTFHWGKYIPKPKEVLGSPNGSHVLFDQNFLKERYEHYSDWLQFRKKMDPNNVFLTNYWKQHLFIAGA